MKKPHSQAKQATLLQEFIEDMLWEEEPAQVSDRIHGKANSATFPEKATQPIVQPNTEQTESEAAHSTHDQPRVINKQTAEPNQTGPNALSAHSGSESSSLRRSKSISHEEPLAVVESYVAGELTTEQVDIDEKLSKVQSLLSNMPVLTAPAVQEKIVEKVVQKADVKTATKTAPESLTKPAEIKTKTASPDIAKQSRPQITEALKQPLKEAQTVTPEATEDISLQEVFSDLSSREEVRLKQLLGDEFQTLIFDVGKLPLAVPLVKLGGIHAYSEEDITPLFGTPDWFKGLIPAEQGNIMLVDTARFVMPEKYEQIKDQLDYKYAILLDDTRWALACTNVREAKSMSLDDVRWSEKGTKKAWFAGMVVQYMCALLEVDSLINLLYRQGKSENSTRN